MPRISGSQRQCNLSRVSIQPHQFPWFPESFFLSAEIQAWNEKSAKVSRMGTLPGLPRENHRVKEENAPGYQQISFFLTSSFLLPLSLKLFPREPSQELSRRGCILMYFLRSLHLHREILLPDAYLPAKKSSLYNRLSKTPLNFHSQSPTFDVISLVSKHNTIFHIFFNPKNTNLYQNLL